MKKFVIKTFYCSENEDLALEVTGLCMDELESVVGRFRKNSSRKNKLRGEVLVFYDGCVVIRHHFTKKIIWEGYV